MCVFERESIVGVCVERDERERESIVGVCVERDERERESVVGVCKGEKKRACVFVCVCRVCFLRDTKTPSLYVHSRCLHACCVCQ